MHKYLGTPYEEEKKLNGFSLIAVLVAGEPRMSRT